MNRDTSPGRSCGVEIALDRGARQGAGAADLFEDPFGAGVELVVRHDLADQAHALAAAAASISAAVKKR